MQTQRKAVALISGGLDSLLAAKAIQDQGIHVEGLNFFTGFCVEGHTHAIRAKDRAKPKRNNALWVAEQLGIKLHIIDISEPYKDIVINPKHGYGQNLNPCLDCKIFMVNQAKTWGFMQEHDFDFIITGEVIGQRPKSQRKETMPIIARESGADDLLLRPLCALNLPPTRPEREGWVDRSKLFGFSGRNRKPQMALAEHYGFENYAQPAGGCCFLTDRKYSDKLADLWQARGTREYSLDDIMLLKIGRHIRPLSPREKAGEKAGEQAQTVSQLPDPTQKQARAGFKMIIGREEGENAYLEGYRKQFHHLRIESHPGPLTLIDGDPSASDLQLAARIAARYSQGRDADQVVVAAITPAGESRQLVVQPLPPTQIPDHWHV